MSAVVEENKKLAILEDYDRIVLIEDRVPTRNPLYEKLRQICPCMPVEVPDDWQQVRNLLRRWVDDGIETRMKTLFITDYWLDDFGKAIDDTGMSDGVQITKYLLRENASVILYTCAEEDILEEDARYLEEQGVPCYDLPDFYEALEAYKSIYVMEPMGKKDLELWACHAMGYFISDFLEHGNSFLTLGQAVYKNYFKREHEDPADGVIVCGSYKGIEKMSVRKSGEDVLVFEFDETISEYLAQISTWLDPYLEIYKKIFMINWVLNEVKRIPRNNRDAALALSARFASMVRRLGPKEYEFITLTFSTALHEWHKQQLWTSEDLMTFSGEFAKHQLPVIEQVRYGIIESVDTNGLVTIKNKIYPNRDRVIFNQEYSIPFSALNIGKGDVFREVKFLYGTEKQAPRIYRYVPNPGNFFR